MKDEGSASIDAAILTRMATGYLARYAASSHRLRQVLERRLRRWHTVRDLALPDRHAAAVLIDAVVARVVAMGLVDDEAFALSKARRLVDKGLPRGRVRLALRSEGLDTDHAGLDHVIVEDEAVQAHRYAARKRLGPFRTRARAPFRDKDIRSLIRAGFSMRHAVAVIDAEPRDEDATPGD